MYTVSITKQGQISIPAKFRKELNLNESKKATVKLENNRLIVEPVADIAELAGVFHRYAIKNKPIEEVIKMEKKAWENAVVEKYRKLQRRKSSKKLYVV